MRGNGATAGIISALGTYTDGERHGGNGQWRRHIDVNFTSDDEHDCFRRHHPEQHSLQWRGREHAHLATGTNVITTGGILVSSTVGNFLSTITGNTLEGSSGGDLIVNQWNTSNSLTIASNIVNNTSATAFTKAGPGTLTLSGTNTYTGGTFISGGTLAVTADTNLGGAGTITINGGTLQYTAPTGNATISRWRRTTS